MGTNIQHNTVFNGMVISPSTLPKRWERWLVRCVKPQNIETAKPTRLVDKIVSKCRWCMSDCSFPWISNQFRTGLKHVHMHVRDCIQGICS